MRFKDKVAIVTGGAQGIGRATVELFAQEGAKVVIVDVDEALAQKTAQEISSTVDWQGAVVAQHKGAAVTVESPPVMGLKADVRDYAQCEIAVKAALDKFSKIDILVNNAGITKDNLLMRMSETEWDLVLDINLKGVFNFTKAVARPMLRAHSGRIINISSIVGQEGNAGQVNYAASKGGIIAMTKSCAKEFGSRNILVNAIAPGFIHTRLTDVLPEEVRQSLKDRALLGRMGEPIEIARVVAFLASEDASYITGQVIAVNGGMYV